MGKIALHGPKKVLIRLDRGITLCRLRRRHSFSWEHFRSCFMTGLFLGYRFCFNAVFGFI